VAYAGYYAALFFAHWFGSSRFDVDGDGEFDPSDVQAFLKNRGILAHHFHNPKAKAAIRQKHQAKQASRAVLKQKLQDKAKQRAARAAQASQAAQSEASGVGEQGPKWDAQKEESDRDLEDIINAHVDGEAEEDLVYDNLVVKQIPPAFIITEVVVCFLFWFVGAIVYSGKHEVDFWSAKGGLDTTDDYTYDLRWSNSDCDDLRWQIWRWISYQFTHIGIAHILMNCILCVVMGIPLEGVHGWWRMAIMFNVGVFGGAMCYYVTDGHHGVVGCSGGCYSLIGIHIADLIMNWSQKKFRFPTLFFLVFLIGVDVINVLVTETEGTSHAAHVGGAIAGIIIGVTVCRNLMVKEYEKIFKYVLVALGLALTLFCWIWIIVQSDGPRNIFDAASGKDGYCVTLQYWDKEINSSKMLCTNCGTKDCIESLTEKYQDCCTEPLAGCTCYQVEQQSEEVCDSYAQWV